MTVEKKAIEEMGKDEITCRGGGFPRGSKSSRLQRSKEIHGEGQHREGSPCCQFSVDANNDWLKLKGWKNV